MEKQKTHTIIITESQRQYLINLMAKDFKYNEKKGYPNLPEVEALDSLLMKD